MGIPPTNFQNLKKLTQLKELSLNCHPILHKLPQNMDKSSQQAFPNLSDSLKELVNLEKLELNVPLGDPDLGFFASLPKLRTLSVKGFAVSENNIELILKATALSTLNLKDIDYHKKFAEYAKEKYPNLTINLIPRD